MQVNKASIGSSAVGTLPAMLSPRDVDLNIACRNAMSLAANGLSTVLFNLNPFAPVVADMNVVAIYPDVNEHTTNELGRWTCGLPGLPDGIVQYRTVDSGTRWRRIAYMPGVNRDLPRNISLGYSLFSVSIECAQE